MIKVTNHACNCLTFWHFYRSLLANKIAEKIVGVNVEISSKRPFKTRNELNYVV